MQPANNILENHPYAEIFPMMNGEDYSRLVDDIRHNGLLEPIWVLDGKILDGRNRYKACLELGITPAFKTYQGNDALKFVMSLNLARRHLNASQCAFVALEVERVLAEEAKGRQIEAGKEFGRGQEKLVEKIPQAFEPEQKSREKAASLVGGTNARYVQDAKKIERDAPEVKALVMAGTVNMTDAVKLAKLEPEKRSEIMTKVSQGQSATDALKVVRGTLGTGENEWYTPLEYIERAKKVMGEISLDPASSELAQSLVAANDFFTLEDDGLEQDWIGSIWLNPPYAQPFVAQFIEKLCSEVKSGRCQQAILLTHNYTDTKWFQEAAKVANHICFTRGRIKFYSPSGEVAAPTQGQAFFYFGANGDKFISEFSSVGFVVEVSHAV